MLNTLLLSGVLALNLQLATPVPADDVQPKPEAEQGSAGAQGGGQQEPGGLRFVWRAHPSIRAGSWLRVDFIGKFHWDAREPGDDPIAFDATELHRARIGIEGELFRHIQFSIERELTEREAQTVNLTATTANQAPGTATKAWKDVYVEANYTDKAQVRLGKFKIPFGLDQLTGVTNLDFVYRTLSGTYLAPARDIGGMVHGEFFDGTLGYSGGLFRHDGDNAKSRLVAGGDRTGAGRVTVRPFRPIKTANIDRLEVGSAVAVSKISDQYFYPNGLRARTTMSQFVFYEPVFVKGYRKRFETDVDWFVGPLGARGEYTEVHDDRKGQGFGDQALPPARARSWYLSGTYVLTGENKQRPVEPKHRFGAIEVAGRFERIWFDSAGGTDEPLRNPRAETILTSGDRILTVGVNWYLNRWVKLQMDGIREHLEDAQRSPLLDNSLFWSSVFRAQLGI